MNIQYWAREPTLGDLLVVLLGYAFVYFAGKWGNPKKVEES